MLRKFFADTADLVREILSRLGISRSRRRWPLPARTEDDSAPALPRRAEHRMCPACRALVPSSDRVCPECGAALGRAPGRRGPASFLLPNFGSASTALLSAIVVIYVAMVVAAPSSRSPFAPAPELMIQMGAKITQLIFFAGEWWRLVNPVFLHWNLMHILFNGYALANLGPLVESAVGGRRLLVLFTGTGIASFAVSAVLSPRGIAAGASGAIFGLIGYGIVMGYLHRDIAFRHVAPQLLFWAALNFVVFGLLVPGVDNAAHFGGFAAGCAFGLFATGRPSRRPWIDRLWTLAAIVAVLLPLCGFAMSFIAGGRAAHLP
ncbi:MAG: rhomboid family intramembrane serine protease [Acidobacteria bacterium]|nr:rhomboid family intramembrane serine protease [Acidobacteriota bacterium]